MAGVTGGVAVDEAGVDGVGVFAPALAVVPALVGVSAITGKVGIPPFDDRLKSMLVCNAWNVGSVLFARCFPCAFAPCDISLPRRIFGRVGVGVSATLSFAASEPNHKSQITNHKSRDRHSTTAQRQHSVTNSEQQQSVVGSVRCSVRCSVVVRCIRSRFGVGTSSVVRLPINPCFMRFSRICDTVPPDIPRSFGGGGLP